MAQVHNLKLSNLFHIEAGQLIKRNIDDLVTANINLTTDHLVQNFVNKMIADSVQMDLALIQIKAHQETEALETLDIKRDTSVRVLRMQAKIYRSSNIPAEVDAYNVLKIAFNAYKDIEKMNYEAENNAIDNFVIELAKPVYTSAIATLNLSGLITRMTNDNAAFKTVFSTRSTTAAATTTYDAKAIRKTMMANYNAYILYIQSLTNANEGLPNHAYYLSIFNLIDNARRYFSDILARRG